jgi:hypothetical protein
MRQPSILKNADVKRSARVHAARRVGYYPPNEEQCLFDSSPAFFTI